MTISKLGAARFRRSNWQSSIRHGVTQLFITLSIYFLALTIAITLTQSTDHWSSVFWLFLAWGLVGLSIVRLFIIQHDCAHYSLFPEQRLNRMVGTVLGILSLTPHAYWRRAHIAHHRTSGNLDSRGVGDIHTMTVAEYQKLSAKKRLFYRLYRNPWVIFLIGPIWQFGIYFRWPLIASVGSRERLSIHFTNFALATALLVVLQFEVGIKLVIGYLVAMQVAGGIGLVLFYVQHQFESAYWRSRPEWFRQDAALLGSSHLVLPSWLEWLVARINLHHVHHLVPWVPNYQLRQFMVHHSLDQTSVQLLPREVPSCFRLHLYSEDLQKMVSFKMVRSLRESSEKSKEES